MKRKISLEEIVDDIIYFSLSALIALIATFLFDIHHSFYQESIFPLKFLLKSYIPYIIAAFGGGILGLIWIKLFIFALQQKTFFKIKKSVRKIKRVFK